MGYDEYLSKNQTTLQGKIAGDEPYFDSDEVVSFEIDIDDDINEKYEVELPIKRQRKARRAKRNKKENCIWSFLSVNTLVD